MTETNEHPPKKNSIRDLPRNVWAVGFTSMFMDISSEMVLNLLSLFLANVLGVTTSIIGLIDGVAEATASILKLFSGWLSDRIGGRKWLAVFGYGVSAITKPFFYIASSWGLVAGVRWADRVGKGIRTAPRDALVADSVTPQTRGIAFGFHRAMDTAGAMLGILIAALVVWLTQKNELLLSRSTFQTIVLISLIPAFLAVLTLAFGAKDVTTKGKSEAPRISLKSMGRPFSIFLVIVSIFTLGNSADSFLVLRAQNLGCIRAWNYAHAGSFQPDLHVGLNPCRLALRPDWTEKIDHWRVAGLCADLFWFCGSAKRLAGVGALCGLWAVLWAGVWFCQRTGVRPGS